jgi:Zn-dependent peptidase ImmA (M78 family)
MHDTYEFGDAEVGDYGYICEAFRASQRPNAPEHIRVSQANGADELELTEPAKASELSEPLSVLRSLRNLMPRRRLSFREALERAELQATCLLEMTGVTTLRVPNEVITDLPKVRVEMASNIPLSGSAHWEDMGWIIYLDESDHPNRQRFSLMHEYKHIIDHDFGSYIAPPFEKYACFRSEAARQTADFNRYERVADHFAACLLMPRPKIKSVFYSGEQDIEKLAVLFGVSELAMSYRLQELGLISRKPGLTESFQSFTGGATAAFSGGIS